MSEWPGVWSYDSIAAVYATDMGQSMPFDDVGYYHSLARRSDTAAVLELGCGTGRILLPLLRAGIHIIGVDRSLPMLEQLRRSAPELKPQLAQMDLHALALRGSFRLILAPYSLITYLTCDQVVDHLLAELRALLAQGGALVLDAFVPRPAVYGEAFRIDYVRPHGAGSLQRAKRIRALEHGCNRIERRYRLLDERGQLLQEFSTVERIRPYAPQALRDVLQRNGLRIVDECWDYGNAAGVVSAQFFTVEAVAK